MNGQLYFAYCSRFGEDTTNCQHRNRRTVCAACQFCQWVERPIHNTNQKDENEKPIS